MAEEAAGEGREAAEIAKLRAEAAKAEAEAAKARADAAAAEVAAGAAGAKAQAEVEAARLKALFPDFGKAERGKLDVAAEKAGSAPLAFHALREAAAAVVAALEPLAAGLGRVLVTSDPDLATAAGAYLEVEGAVGAMAEHAGRVEAADPTRTAGFKTLIDPLTLVGALSAALPGLMSLLRVDRSVATSAVAGNDLAAAAAVAGLLIGKGVEVVHDDFRLPARARAWEAMARLAAARTSLAAARARATPAGGARPSAALAQWLDEADRAVAAIDALEARLRSAPAGGRSPLAAAALAEPLFAAEGAAPATAHVLLVRAEGGQATQTVTDRAFVSADRIALIAEVAITYMLLDVGANRLVAAGTEAGLAQAAGRIGAPLRPVTAEAETDSLEGYGGGGRDG